MLDFRPVIYDEDLARRPEEPLGGARLHTYASTAAAVVACVGLAVAAVLPIAHRHDYISVAVICLVALGGTIIVAMRLLPRGASQGLPRTTTFQACGVLDEKQVWHRPQMLEVLMSKIDAGGIVVVVGPSGAGKSVLLRNLLAERLDSDQLIYRSQRDGWPGRDQAFGRVVVLDQFEHALLGLPWGTPLAKERLNEIHNEVLRLQGVSRAVILGIREDWYIKLAFMKELLPSLNDSTILSYVGSELDSDVVEEFAKRITTLDPRRPLPDIPEGTTPMELQAAGQLHELAMGSRTIAIGFRNHTLNVHSAVADLTRLIATRAPSKHVVLKTLHALKSAREGGGALTTAEIVATTGDFEDTVGTSLGYLRSSGLVTLTGPNAELTHDALLNSVEQVTSDYLDPAERDNIRQGAQDLRSLVFPQERSAVVPWIVIGLVAVMVTCRALIPADDLWYQFSALNAPMRTGILDPIYLLAAIPFLAWCYYIVRFHIDIYRFCDRTRRQTFISYCNTFLLLGVIAWTMLMVEWWGTAIAVGGLMQATKALSYARDKTRPLASRRLYQVYANRTYNNCGLLFVLGTVFAIAVPNANWSQHSLQWAYLFGSVVLTNAAIYLYAQALSTKSAARSRGFLCRVNPRDSD